MTTPPDSSRITAAGLAAFQKLAAPLLRIIEGKGTIDDDEAAANAVLDAVALFDPAAMPVIALVEEFEPFIVGYISMVKASPATAPTPDLFDGTESANGE